VVGNCRKIRIQGVVGGLVVDNGDALLLLDRVSRKVEGFKGNYNIRTLPVGKFPPRSDPRHRSEIEPSSKGLQDE
jgi:hypothetical protein